jgi:hypothetical protein
VNYKVCVLALFSALSVLTGCATIVGSPTQVLPVSSTPDGAAIVITDETGAEVFKGTTPTTVTLAKSDGSYFGGKSYKVAISKPGYASFEMPVKARASGWYIGGNLVFGGLIGWLIVDPLNGDMYTLSEKEVRATLTSSTAAVSQADAGTEIVLLGDVPEDLRAKMVKVN